MRLSLFATLTSTALTASLFAAPVFAATPAEVAQTYVDMAAAGYGEILMTAQALQVAVAALIAAPADATLAAAKTAWLAARVPYQQTEAFRFGNPIVDDWEGKVNAWPLAEGLIDYVDASYGQSEENPLSTLNIIAHPSFTLFGADIDASALAADFISDTLHAVDRIEAHVASGYHAIEFLLWG